MDQVAGREMVAALLALAASQDLRARAEAGCRESIRSTLADGDDLRGWSVEEIEMHFHNSSLTFDHGILDYPYIDTRLGLYVRDLSGVYFLGLRPIGSYRLITLLDGTDDDDYFVLDTDKNADEGSSGEPGA